MKKFFISFISIFVFTSIFLITSVKAAPTETKRLWGDDRYQTCSQIAAEGWKNSYYAVIVNGENFPDALSASTLAKKYNAPILLTEKDKLDWNIQDQLTRLNVKKAFIVGGPGVVSPVVQSDLNNIGIEVERLYGSDRSETSVAVANQIGTDNGLIITTDSDYTDALSAAPIAAKLQMPIVLVPKNSTPNSVANFIAGKNIPKTYVLGGADLIINSVASMFPNVQRIDGNDKYERNINIIKAFGDKFDFSNVCLAYSEGFADALSGSAFAALNGNPVILMGNELTGYSKNLLNDKSDAINTITVFGGPAGIKDEKIYNAFTKLDADSSKLEKIKNLSIYKFELKDENGENYSAYIYSDDCQKETASFDNGTVWAGASEGNVLYKGSFKIASLKNDTGYIKEQSLNNTTFNISRNLVRVHKNNFSGYPDFLLIGEPQCSNASSLSIYCIKDGNLNLVPFYTEGRPYNSIEAFNSVSIFFKQVDENIFEISNYANAGELAGKFTILSSKFDKKTNSFVFQGNRHMSMNEYYNYVGN